MRLNPIAVLKERESPVGAEAGLDPLPIEKGPLEPLYKAWSAFGAWPLATALMAAAAGVSMPLVLALPFERIMGYWPQPLMAAVTRLTCSQRKLTYHPDFDPRRVSVFMMNHTSVLDAHVACWAIPGPFCGIMHAHHFDVPIYGWLMERGNGIGVSKGANGQSRVVAGQVRDRVARGVSILGFPEGRRTQNGRVLPFRTGLFKIARDEGLPVVPLVTRGLWQILRRGEWVVRPSTLEVYVGPQIETAGRSDAEIQQLAERLGRFTADFVERGELADARSLAIRARA